MRSPLCLPEGNLPENRSKGRNQRHHLSRGKRIGLFDEGKRDARINIDEGTLRGTANCPLETRDCTPVKRKGPRCILVHRGPLGHALMVEAGGVEPPSENIPRKASTGLGQEQISPPCSPLTGHRAAIPPVQISWKLPAGAKLHQPDAMSPAGRIRRRPL